MPVTDELVCPVKISLAELGSCLDTDVLVHTATDIFVEQPTLLLSYPKMMRIDLTLNHVPHLSADVAIFSRSNWGVLF